MKTIALLIALAALASFCFAAEPENPPVETKEPSAVEKALALHEKFLWVARETPKPPAPAPFIGISMSVVAPADVEAAGGPKNCAGIKIDSVVAGSPAQKAEIKAGDIIFALVKGADKSLFTPPDEKYSPLSEIPEFLKDKKPGDTIEFFVLRDKAEIKKSIVLAARPVYDMTEAKHPELRAPGEKPSLLMQFLDENKLLADYVVVADSLYEASNMLQGEKRVVEDKPDFFRLKNITYLLRHPENTSVVSEEISDSIEAEFNAEKYDIPALVAAAASWLDETLDAPAAALKLNGDAQDIRLLVKHFEEALAARDAALKALSAGEIKALQTLPTNPADKDNEDALLAALKAAAKVDYKKLFEACRTFAQIADPSNLAALKKCAESLKNLEVKNVDGVTGRVLYYEDSKIGKIIVGGDGPNTYSTDAALIIDLGGNDSYNNNSGSSTETHPFSVCIDLAGNDVYLSSRPVAQGSAFLGAGILVDVEGDDTYRSGPLSQGYGFVGVGILADLAGDDTYRGVNFVQAVGHHGIGLVLDASGEDSYHADNFAQGVGLCKGFGALVEAAGNDSYYLGGKQEDHRDPTRSYISMGQGFGFGIRPYDIKVGTSGGIGLLLDEKGHDRYVADYFCQGSSYWYALGILRDRAGCDHYFSGRYSQGAGIHLSLGALIDDAGDDSYIAYFGVGQGCGHDFSYGILEDKAGDDFYEAGVLSQGAGNDCGIGVLFDHSGNDIYVGRDQVQGHGNFNEMRKEGSVGIFMDLGGDDKYIAPSGSANDTRLKKPNATIGLFLDEHAAP